MIARDAAWDIRDIKVGKVFIRVHFLTRFSDIPSLGFKGYFIARACCGENIEVPLDAIVSDDVKECLCPSFADCNSEL